MELIVSEVNRQEEPTQIVRASMCHMHLVDTRRVAAVTRGSKLRCKSTRDSCTRRMNSFSSQAETPEGKNMVVTVIRYTVREVMVEIPGFNVLLEQGLCQR